MDNDPIANIWRYNINATVQRYGQPTGPGSSGGCSYRIGLFHKESRKSVSAILPASAIRYLREIAPGLAIRSLCDVREPKDDMSQFTMPIKFHMCAGMNVAQMAANEMTSSEATLILGILTRAIEKHPENACIVKGLETLKSWIQQENVDAIQNLTAEYTSAPDTALVYSSPWMRQSATQSGNLKAGKVNIFFNRDCVRPFAIRVYNYPSDGTFPPPSYPAGQDQIESMYITLSAEEFIGAILVPACEDMMSGTTAGDDTNTYPQYSSK